MYEHKMDLEDALVQAEQESIVHNQKILKISIFNTILSIIIIILLLLCWPFKCNHDPDTPSAPIFNVINDSNIEWGPRETKPQEEIQEELKQKVENGMMNISMNTNPVFEDGTSPGNLLITNEDINLYPQVVEIYRDDTGELIYRSGAIPVGARIDKAMLMTPLTKGVYDCTAHFNQISQEGTLLGKACAKIQIYILN